MQHLNIKRKNSKGNTCNYNIIFNSTSYIYFCIPTWDSSNQGTASKDISWMAIC